MTYLAIDTFAAVKQLRDLGMPEDQATGIVRLITDASDQNAAQLATKQDLKDGNARLEHKIEQVELKIEQVEHKIESEIAILRSDLKGEILSSQNRIMVLIGGLMLAVPGVYIAIGKAVHLF